MEIRKFTKTKINVASHLAVFLNLNFSGTEKSRV